MTYVPDVGYFVLVTELPVGGYYYRFVVDGRWKVADGDEVREDAFGEFSHYVEIGGAAGGVRRFPTAASASAAVVGVESARQEGEVVMDVGDSGSEESDSEDEDDDEEEEEEEVYNYRGVSVKLPPRVRGDGYIEDYDEECGDFDLQADVFEAMKDVAEVTTGTREFYSPGSVGSPRGKRRGRPGRRVLRKVWGMLFGDAGEVDENDDPREEREGMRPTHNHNAHAIAGKEAAAGTKKGLKIWFPNERNFPSLAGVGRKIAPAETRDVIDVDEKAMKLHQAEENANNRQLLGKTLFAQGKYDAALALFSLSVKLREDNGLKYAKTTAIAHTDVASAFIHLEDYKNAEKHLRISLAIYEKSTFSGGRAQLGDVHCFLGVIADMKGELRVAELGYRNAIDLYERSKATDSNPNYATAIENLKANQRRQKLGNRQKPVVQQVQQGGQPLPQRVPPSGGKQQVPPRPNPTLSNSNAHSLSNRAPPRGLPNQPATPPGAVRPTAASRPAPAVPGEYANLNHRQPNAPRPGPGVTRNSPARRPLPPPSHAHSQTPPRHQAKQMEQVAQNVSAPPPKRQSTSRDSRPKTWKALADHARASMPAAPPVEENLADEDEEPAAGSYEEMCRSWHKDGRRLLVQGKYKEAIDMYTLAIYTRKRHGPWVTQENAQTHVEYARALFATKDLGESSSVLRDAIAILEQLDSSKVGVLLGDVWGNLGAVLDRVGGMSREAEAAHCAGMVAYGRTGMSTEDAKWLKAWKNLCSNLNANGRGANSTEEVWQSIDLQIRGIKPMTKSSAVLRR